MRGSPISGHRLIEVLATRDDLWGMMHVLQFFCIKPLEQTGDCVLRGFYFLLYFGTENEQTGEYVLRGHHAPKGDTAVEDESDLCFAGAKLRPS